MISVYRNFILILFITIFISSISKVSSSSENTITKSIQDLMKMKLQNKLNEEKNIINFENLLFRNNKIYKKFSIEPLTGYGVSFHNNGQLKTKLRIENGKLIPQKWECFQDTGKLKYYLEYMEFKIEDSTDFIFIHDCLNVLSKSIKKGIERYYYRNGNIENEVNWFDGKSDAIEKTYNPDGKLQREAIYKNDKLISEKIYSKKIKEIIKKSNISPEKIKKPITQVQIKKIREHISKCWSIPFGLSDFKDSVVLKISLNENMGVISAKITNTIQYGKDAKFRAVADSARRAVMDCSPLPIDKSYYEVLKEFVMSFNAKLN